jgi:hypothetical protein
MKDALLSCPTVFILPQTGIPQARAELKRLEPGLREHPSLTVESSNKCSKLDLSVSHCLLECRDTIYYIRCLNIVVKINQMNDCFTVHQHSKVSSANGLLVTMTTLKTSVFTVQTVEPINDVLLFWKITS